jgi:hypothetical protein
LAGAVAVDAGFGGAVLGAVAAVAVRGVGDLVDAAAVAARARVSVFEALDALGDGGVAEGAEEFVAGALDQLLGGRDRELLFGGELLEG